MAQLPGQVSSYGLVSLAGLGALLAALQRRQRPARRRTSDAVWWIAPISSVVALVMAWCCSG